MNLCSVAPETAKRITDFVCNLLPLTVNLPLTLQNLNKEFFILPEMERGQANDDVSFIGLSAGRLQVADGTCVILDETVMEAGTLEERGTTFSPHSFKDSSIWRN